jgi:hypothetical protein
MLAFIVPLKSSKVSGSWQQVCDLLERTLKSLCNQTLPQFTVIVVCHERPDIAFTHPQIIYIQVDFPLPEDYASKEQDKMRKMLVGVIRAKSMNASHVMFVDADDCVSKHLALYVNSHSDCKGWYISKGYDYREDVGLLRIRNKNLHLRTNTSHIIRIDLLEADLNMNVEQIKRGNCVLYHIDTVNILKERGTPLDRLPFRGAIYITDNGENMWWSQQQVESASEGFREKLVHYLKQLYQSLITRSITEAVQDEFGLYDIKNTSKFLQQQSV